MSRADRTNPEHEALLADSVGLALLVVLETLTPAERVAFVFHDMFAVPFDEIAPIVGRSSTAARQLASRARCRVQGPKVPEADHTYRREIVDAFLAASRGGDFEALLRFSTRTSCCEPTPPPRRLAHRRRAAAPLLLPIPSLGVPVPHNRRS